MVEMFEFRKGKVIPYTLPKHQAISFHDSRKSFVCVGFELGMREEDIRAITDHRDYKSFKRYLEVRDQMKQKAMKVWDTAPKLKVVKEQIA